MKPRHRRRLRAALALAAGALLLLASVTAWLLRDPRPYFAERRSTLASIEEGPVEVSGGHASQAVRLRAGSGLAFDVLVRAPAEAASDPRSLFLILGGYRTGERAAALVEDTRGAVVAAMGYPYDGPLQPEGLALLAHIPDIRRALLDTPPAIQLALDYFVSRPDIDQERIELVGVSLGALFTPAAAALDPRVDRLWILHGAGRPYTLLEHGLRPYIRYRLPRALAAQAVNVLAAGPRLAPERWVPLVAPRPVVMINSSGDQRLPRDAVEALHEAARDPKEVVWISGPHVQPNRPDAVRRLIDEMLTRGAALPPTSP